MNMHEKTQNEEQTNLWGEYFMQRICEEFRSTACFLFEVRSDWRK